MSAIPGDLETDKQPPMTIPLRHFVVSLVFLLAGILLALATATEQLPGLVNLAHIHVLLAGWIGITIMGAMTQFVPVWSATALHSRRLAVAQLWLVVGGLTGFIIALLAVSFVWLVVFGAVMLAGFWLFVYNIARTLPPVTDYDITEAHFALALVWFLLATAMGFVLAVDLASPFLADLGLSRAAFVQSHATLAVFGAILTTVIGALYQLATMFTQTELHGIDRPIQQFEMVAYPLGVASFAAGRLLEITVLARVGGLLVIATLVGIGIILARKLVETQVKWTPMLSRYAIVSGMVGLWGLLTGPAWIRDPLAHDALLAAPDAFYLLVMGVIGFVVLGTLYHVVPFIIWVHRYSDLLGYEPVPMIDDLYSDRLAAADFGCLLAGTLLLFAGAWAGLPTALLTIGGTLVLVGGLLFVVNMLLVIREHSPHTMGDILGVSSILRTTAERAESGVSGDEDVRR